MKNLLGLRVRAIRKAFKSDGVIIYRAFVHPQVSWFVKRLILLVAAYIISPIDIIPGWIVGFGILDDIAIAVLAITQIKKLIPAKILAELKKKAA